ncbi:alkaline phosphatase family protein [Paraburkholderia caffeinilytica]|uniref:alkaline phosphatase family protein n=1 Tax=Paraburkholderia caffeinilytica TaxID=1761016 RepID=UPI0038BDC5E4
MGSAALAIATAATLAACSGGQTTSSAAGNTQVNGAPPSSSDQSAGAVVNRALVIDLDGATYNALKAGIAAGTLPNLAKLQIQLAYSGGVTGTLSQQPTFDTPGWATLLTGTWAARHQVLSDAPQQTPHSESIFQLTRASSTGLNGVAAASSGLAQLLSVDHSAGYLDTLADCSGSATASDCVTSQTVQMIDKGYTTIFAQYHAAQDAAVDYGLAAAQYANTLTQLDQSVGTLVAETAKVSNSQWLIVVTGNHGLSANSQDDGLPLVPESTTFIGLNQSANNGAGFNGATAPTTFSQLYASPSIADVTPTLLAYLSQVPASAAYTMDGGELLGAQPVSQLVATVNNNNSPTANVVLQWSAPASGTVAVLRDGKVIASNLPAGTSTYTDTQLAQELTAQGSYLLNYTVQVGATASPALRSTLAQVSFVPPIPLASTLTNGLTVYYPFGSALPPVDKLGHSTLGPYAADLPAAAASIVSGPPGSDHGLLVDTNFVDSNGFEGYKLTPASGFDVSQGSAPQFTVGFWFKVQSCIATNDVPVFSNKNYVSGGNAGVAIGLFASSTANQCGIAFNIGSGAGVRTDGPTSPYTQVSVGQWIYIALSVDGVAKTMSMYALDPLLGKAEILNKPTGSVDLSKLSPFGQWGVGEDGTGTYLMNKCNGSVTSPYTAGKCATAPTYQQMFGDLAMWNRALSQSEVESIFLSQKPLSTLLPN